MAHDSLLHLRHYLGLPNVNKMIENRRLKFTDKLLEGSRFSELCNVFICNLFYTSFINFQCVCVCVCMCVHSMFPSVFMTS